MNLRNRIASWLLRGIHPRDPALAQWLGGAMTAAGVSVTAANAISVAAVYSCIRVLSETLAGLPLIVYRRKAGGGKERATDHWLYSLLHGAPNGWMTSFAWREMGMAHLCLRGAAYSRIVGDARGKRQLIPIHPDRMRTVLLDSGRLAYEMQNQQGGFTTLLQEEVLRIPFMTMDGVRPVTPIQVQRETIGASLASQEYGARFWANDARPTGGWVEMEGDFKSDASSKSFREKWQKAMTGENRHMTPFLPRGMKYHPLSLTMEDAQFLETRKFQRSEIAGLFRVPPHM
ncbi:MAG: phage portal protein, partial [Betaproteobacteria bacterium]|nr:phage portal protein [Betaproteobacteria bacterium]